MGKKKIIDTDTTEEIKVKFRKRFRKGMTDLKIALFYDESRKQLSRTAMMSFVFFSMAVIIGFAGLVAKLSYDKEIPNNLYVYIGSLCGSGFVQYSFGKVISTRKNDNPEDTANI